ncbi:MAG TPA: hypothetical protein VMP01_10245 [Pirellulaceae bacterium]|nr:hypothetical protein [Pirellulaceae bacterium]
MASGWTAPRAIAGCGDYVIFVGSGQASTHASPLMDDIRHSQPAPARGPVCRGSNCQPTDQAPPRVDQPRQRDAGMPLASSSAARTDGNFWQTSEPHVSLCGGFRLKIKRPPRV